MMILYNTGENKDKLKKKNTLDKNRMDTHHMVIVMF